MSHKSNSITTLLECSKSPISVYLWNGTEIEDALVAQAGQVGNNIRDVTKSISDQQVETRETQLQLLRLGQVLQTTCKLTPGLHRDKIQHITFYAPTALFRFITFTITQIANNEQTNNKNLFFDTI